MHVSCAPSTDKYILCVYGLVLRGGGGSVLLLYAGVVCRPGTQPRGQPAGGGMVEKSGEYLLQRFYHANMDRYCVLALCCVSWCCVCGVRCKVVMKLLIHMKNTNNKK